MTIAFDWRVISTGEIKTDRVSPLTESPFILAAGASASPLPQGRFGQGRLLE